MRLSARHPAIICVTAVFFAGANLSSSVAAPAEPDFYEDVYPFLKANCISCHNKTTTKADLNMETPALMKKGGDSGPSIIPGKSEESLVVEASIHSPEFEMPPKNNKTDAKNLTSSEIEVLKKWIDLGAKDSVKTHSKVVWQALEPGVHPIHTLAMTTDGRFAACGRSNQISVYDLATQQFVTQLVDSAGKTAGAHRALVHSLAFSPDGLQLASGGYREVKIWRKESGGSLARKGDPALAAVVSTMSPNGKLIVCADKIGSLSVLNAADGKVIKKMASVAPTEIKFLRVSPDASKVAVFAEGWNLSVWNLSDGKLLAKQTAPDSALEKQSREAQAKLAAAVKAVSVTTEAIKVAMAAKAATTKALSDAEAKLAAAASPERQKELVDAKGKVALASKTEAGAIASAQITQTTKATADKSAKDAATKLSEARKVAMGALAWTADSKAIMTGGEDKIARVWPLPAAGSTVFLKAKELAGATGGIVALTSAPDLVVVASEDSKLRVWSLSGAKILREIPLKGALSLNLSPDGKLLVTGGSDSAVRIWDVATGKPISELRGTVMTTREVADLEWIIGAEKLEQDFQKTVVTKIVAQDKALDILLKKAEDAIVAMTKALPLKEKEIKPKQDAAVGEQKKVNEAEAVIAKAGQGKADPAMEKALKTAQDKLITAQTEEGSARAAFKAVQSNITDAQAQVKRITASKAENATETAAANTASDAAKVVHTKATTDLAALKKAISSPRSQPIAVTFSGDSKKVAAIFNDGAINVWAVPTGVPIEQVITEATTMASLIWKSDGTFSTCGADTSIATTDANPGWKLERVIGGEKDLTLFADRVNALKFSPDGKTLAVGGGEPSRTGNVTMFDVVNGKPKASWKELHDDAVVSLDFSHDGKLLASGAADKIVRVTDIASGKQVKLFEGHTHYVMGVDFRADDRVLATAGADGVVNAWDMILGERKKKIEGWTKEVTSLQFIGATNQIVTSAGENLIRIVNDDGAQVRSISGLPDFMQVAASTPDGGIIIGGGEDSFLRVWNGNDGKEITSFGSPQ